MDTFRKWWNKPKVKKNRNKQNANDEVTHTHTPNRHYCCVCVCVCRASRLRIIFFFGIENDNNNNNKNIKMYCVQDIAQRRQRKQIKITHENRHNNNNQININQLFIIGIICECVLIFVALAIICSTQYMYNVHRRVRVPFYGAATVVCAAENSLHNEAHHITAKLNGKTKKKKRRGESMRI